MKKTEKPSSSKSKKSAAPKMSVSDKKARQAVIDTLPTDAEEVLAFIKKSKAGVTAEAIRCEIAIEPARLGYVLTRLKSKNLVVGEGATRAMKYTASK